MAEKKRKTELDIEGIAPPPKAEEPPPPPPPPQSEVAPEEHEDAPERKTSPADKRKKLIIVSVAASFVLILGISFSMKSKAPAKNKEKPVHVEEKEATPPPRAKEPPVKSPQIYNLTLEPFIIPVHGKNSDRLIRLGLAIQVSNEDALDEAKENITLIRKSVLFYLNTKDKKDLLDDKSRIKMMEDIKSNVDRSLQSGRALAVLVDEFVVY